MSKPTTTADVLWEHVQRTDLCPGAESFDAWLNVRWIRARIGGWTVPLLPVIGYRNALILHDVHHLLTGYGTSLKGEVELAAWELASGGCGWSLFFWLDRVLAVALGLVLAPVRMARAFRAGLGCCNLYGTRREDVLSSEYEDISRRVLLPR